MTEERKPRAPRQQHMGISITNTEIEAQLRALQTVIGTQLGNRRVGMQMVVDYLLQSQMKANEFGCALEPQDFTPRLKKHFKPR